MNGRVTGHNDYDLVGAALQRAGIRFCIGRFDVDWHVVRASRACGVVAVDPGWKRRGAVTGSVGGVQVGEVDDEGDAEDEDGGHSVCWGVR